MILSFINDDLLNRLFNVPNFRKFQYSNNAKLHDHFYVIVMPDILHFLIPCLRLIPDDVRVLLILNGTARWEERYLRRHFWEYPIFKLRTFPHSSLTHGIVLNLLIDNNESNFGILDHDLFIFKRDIFDGLSFNEDEFVIGAYRLSNTKAMLEFPTTHFLFINMELIKRIRSKYHIGAQVYYSIPRNVRSQLLELNLGYGNFLKEYLYYFDTMNMLFAMSFYEGLSARFLELTNEDIYHVGGTSHFEKHLYLQYVGLRFLEMIDDKEIEKKYSFLYSQFSSSEDVLNSFPTTEYASKLVAGIDRVIDRIEGLGSSIP